MLTPLQIRHILRVLDQLNTKKEMKMSITIKSEVITLTPARAKELLKMNTSNRPLRKGKVETLKGIIDRGEWKLNGDAVRVSITGVLLDGQHRLSAVVAGDKAVETFLITGLPDEVFNTIDVQSTPRTSADVLAIKGHKNTATLAASAALLHKHSIYGNPYHGTPGSSATTQQIEAIVEGNVDLQQAASWASNAWVKTYVSKSIGAFIKYVFDKDDAFASYSFFEGLCTGAGLSADSPVLLLRDRLMTDKMNSKRRTANSYKVALIFKAYKLHKDDATVKTLRIRTEGDAPEKSLFTL